MIVSVATAMIPFLENDDANRALMGANMQRQAVPLLTTEAPDRRHRHGAQVRRRLRRLVIAEGERHRRLACAPTASVVRYRRRRESSDYKLIKFARSNQGTCINQRPIVSTSASAWTKGEVIADGPVHSTTARSALGKNVLIGFMTWEGYNYEDAILLNERLVQRRRVHLHPY